MGTPAFEKPEGRTADPSTSLRSGRDDKGEGGVSIEDFVSGWTETAGPSTALRSGRDDTSAGGVVFRVSTRGPLNCRSLRFGPTAGRGRRDDKGDGSGSTGAKAPTILAAEWHD